MSESVVRAPPPPPPPPPVPGGYKKVLITASQADIARWTRRVGEERAKGSAYASRSGVIRLDAHAARRLHHSLRSPIQALALLATMLRQDAVTAGEAASRIDAAVMELTRLVAAEE